MPPGARQGRVTRGGGAETNVALAALKLPYLLGRSLRYGGAYPDEAAETASLGFFAHTRGRCFEELFSVGSTGVDM